MSQDKGETLGFADMLFMRVLDAVEARGALVTVTEDGDLDYHRELLTKCVVLAEEMASQVAKEFKEIFTVREKEWKEAKIAEACKERGITREEWEKERAELWRAEVERMEKQDEIAYEAQLRDQKLPHSAIRKLMRKFREDRAKNKAEHEAKQKAREAEQT